MPGTSTRPGFHTVAPYLVVQDAEGLVAFIKEAFDATETFRTTGSAGGLHCEVRIGDSMVMIGGGGAGPGDPMPAMLHLYVADADAVYQRALAAGATSLTAPAEHGDGDRRGGVQDRFGNQWYIATHLGTSQEGKAS